MDSQVSLLYGLFENWAENRDRMKQCLNIMFLLLTLPRGKSEKLFFFNFSFKIICNIIIRIERMESREQQYYSFRKDLNNKF